MKPALGKVLAAIYDAVLDGARTPVALQALAEHVGVAGAGLIIIDKTTNKSRMTRWGFFNGNGNRDEYVRHYSKIDLFRALHHTLPSGTLVRITESFAKRELASNEWYNDWVLKGGCDDTLGGKLYENSTHLAKLVVHHAIGDRHPFPGRPAALARMLDPLCQAAQLKLGLEEVGLRSAVAEAALELVGPALFFVEVHGRLLRANQAAEAILTLDDGLIARSGRIGARRSFENARLMGLIAAAIDQSEPAGGCMLVGRTRA
jgi:hypothetical protein